MADEILVPEQVAEIAARHQPDPAYGRCMACGGTRWPCEVATLAESHMALQARLPLLEAALAVRRAGTRVSRALNATVQDEKEISAASKERDEACERYELLRG